MDSLTLLSIALVVGAILVFALVRVVLATYQPAGSRQAGRRSRDDGFVASDTGGHSSSRDHDGGSGSNDGGGGGGDGGGGGE